MWNAYGINDNSHQRWYQGLILYIWASSMIFDATSAESAMLEKPAWHDRRRLPVLRRDSFAFWHGTVFLF